MGSKQAIELANEDEMYAKYIKLSDALIKAKRIEQIKDRLHELDLIYTWSYGLMSEADIFIEYFKLSNELTKLSS